MTDGSIVTPVFRERKQSPLPEDRAGCNSKFLLDSGFVSGDFDDDSVTLWLSAVCGRRSEAFSLCNRCSLHHFLKVDISGLHICADQLHAEPVADLQTFKTALQSSFNGRMQNTDPRAFVRCAGDNGIELLTDP